MITLFIFLFGLAIGSFLNMVLWRLKQKESFTGRSYCPKCHGQIKWYDNLPILSFLFLGGRCRYCQGKISIQYPLVELAMAIIFTWLYLNFGLSLQFLSLIVFSSFLLVIFVYDLKYYLILDQVSIPAAIVALLFNLYLGFGWQQLVWGGIIGAGFFLLQFMVSKGKWIGGGDIRLGLVMGLMLGIQMLWVALFLAYMLGATVAIFLVIGGRKKMSSQIPFGTFLSLATFLTFLYGSRLLEWYLGLLNL